MNKIFMLGIMIFSAASLTMGVSFALDHVDYSDPNWGCKKWVGIVELAKQDYPHFVEMALDMAERHCGFDVSAIIT